jgi:hypothetical protein
MSTFADNNEPTTNHQTLEDLVLKGKEGTLVAKIFALFNQNITQINIPSTL